MLRPGGRFLCLEFSKVISPVLDRVYDTYSFQVLPALGRVVAGDAASYRYLAESIRRFPDQPTFAELMRGAGFEQVRWRNLGQVSPPFIPAGGSRTEAMLESPRNLWRLVGIGRTLARHNALFPFELLPGAALAASPGHSSTRPPPGDPGSGSPRRSRAGPLLHQVRPEPRHPHRPPGQAIARDLATLQDSLPSFPAEAARAVIAADLEQPVEALFADFRDRPVAAASIAQVHLATTGQRRGGSRVLRPEHREGDRAPRSRLLRVARPAGRRRAQPHLRHYKPVEAVAIFAQVTRRELDLRLEAAAAVELGENARTTRAFACRRWTGGAPTAGWSPSSGSSARHRRPRRA
ncbi:MAG: class I SAM-dependent methyltransferase [Geminicoccaceae bacterium]